MIQTLAGGPSLSDGTVAEWLRLVQAEYREMPGLQLTKPQIRRLWGIEDDVCDALLQHLVATRFLRRTERNAYVLQGTSREK